MDLSYYNPLKRLKLFSSVWEMTSRVRNKINEENPGTSPARFSIFADYLLGWIGHGFSIVQYEDYEIYRLKSCVRKNIVTNRRALKLEALFNNKDDIRFLENKALFNDRFSKYVRRKWILSSEVTRSRFMDVFKTAKRLIVKPIDGERGMGIYIREISSDNDLSELYEEIRNENVLVEDVIMQHDGVSFGRKSVNTIRMYTILDGKGKAHLLKSVLRVGAPGKDVDNYHCGGSIWPLDREEGFVECAGKTLAVTTPIYYLPDRKEFMLGYRVPNYEKAVEAVLYCAELIPTVRYLGWDVAVTEDGVEIIEANSSPDNDFHCLGVERNYYHRLLQQALKK